jgi:hypothetical protein
MYESDFTRFLRELKERNPRIEDEQRKGRAILWDRPQDFEFLNHASESRVPAKPYAYYPLPD